MDSASNEGFGVARRMTVVEVGRRRRWSDETKIGYVTEAFEAESSVAAVSRRYGVSPTQIYQWRAKFFPDATARGVKQFARVVVAQSEPRAASHGRMEVVCANGRQVVVDRDVDVDALLRVVAALEQ